jgi:hypothetical protein
VTPRLETCLAIALCSVLSLPADAMTRIRIGSVSWTFLVKDFLFEVRRDTGAARIVITYINPEAEVSGSDGRAIPRPTVAQIAGLRYDSTTGTVVFMDGGRTTVCATLQNHKGAEKKSVFLKSNGACTVTSQIVSHNEGDAWTARRVQSLETYFEIP